MYYKDYDIIIIGAGHAGCEAANISAKHGNKTLLVTQNLDTVAKMSCNPSIGGIAKGHLVREIDALGGIMAKIIDKTMIQFRMLNTKKGYAVQAMRAQADKLEYHVEMKKYLEKLPNLDLFQDTVVDFIIENDFVIGIVTERGNRISAKAVVLTTGTFMEGKIHIGEFNSRNGRISEPAVLGLSHNLKKLGFNIGKLKTGTPARVARRSIDFNKLEAQIGDKKMLAFTNFSYENVIRPNHPCYIAYTNEKTHSIIRNNFNRSPLFSGKIAGVGPRYCPSIEDKVKKFADKTRHQIFIEPEGLYTDEIYLNGLSSSLPEDVQLDFLHSIKGFENLEVMRPGYAVEYDYLNPKQLFPTLETKRIKNLFIAGQTNGTSGYEEAAAQGLIAGINASLKIRGEEQLFLGRDEAYIGVLIDDLVTQGTKEPYRMFTSRAEYRLLLRQENTDIRLSKYAIKYDLLSNKEKEFLSEREMQCKEIKDILNSLNVNDEEIKILNIDSIKKGVKWVNVIKNPSVNFNLCFELFSKKHSKFKYKNFITTAIDIKYEGYIKRQAKDIQKSKKLENLKIPSNIDYNKIFGIASEGREKLMDIRPLTIRQATAISGITPSDIDILIMYIFSQKKVNSD